jgi:uncharacterized protein YcbK (DUF882 family)
MLPTPRRRRFTGLNERQERVFRVIAVLLIVAVVAGWTYSILDAYGTPPIESHVVTSESEAAPMTRSVTSSLLDSRSPTTAYINDAALTFLDPLRGESGKLRAAFRVPGATLASPPGENVNVLYAEEGEQPIVSTDFRTPAEPGVYKIAVGIDQARRAIDDLNLVTLVPFAEKEKDRIGLYYLGSWPYEKGGTPRSKAYGNPVGFIEVTKENQNTYVSEHFRLRDFLTKDQRDVWPKYLLLDPKLLDKLELTIQELEKQGIDIKHVTVMSGFRTPRYNHGGGNTAGRANLSRHMYGDAADIFIDNNQDNSTDDINRDGRVTVRDAEIVSAAVERVEKKYPALTGGVGTYAACCGHGPFTHIDVRGYRARWRGTGNG